MKKWVWRGVLILSVALNSYWLGKWLLFDQSYTPTEEEAVILGEMIQRTVESDDYQMLVNRTDEQVLAITSSINKNKGGAFPFYMDVYVKTDQQSYIFSCKDKTCAEMHIGGTAYSRYSEEEPRLPLQ